MNNKIIVLYSVLLLPLCGRAQLQPSEYEGIMDKNRITMQDSNRNKSVFYVKDYSKRAKSTRIYYWYAARSIQKSQGAYSGKVLHGSFERFYPDKKIAEKGQFKKGMKQGEWRTWAASGLPSKTSTWKKSHENGKYTLFDQKGEIKEKGHYKDGRPDGKVTQWDADAKTQTFNYYDEGTAISKEVYIQQNMLRRTGNYFGEKWKKLFNRKSKKD